jgi:hypothetical protein
MRDPDRPWWLSEPAPRPEEGCKFIIRGDELLALIEDRRYRLRAVASPIGPERLELVLHLVRGPDWDRAWHVDRVDRYDPEERQRFVRRAAAECQVAPSAIEGDLALLIPRFEQYRDALLQHAAEEKQRTDPTLQ